MLSDLTLKLLEDQQFVTSVEKPPLIPKKNCSYIVSAILIEQGKVLLISEAKWECRGKWYLPAGRVEPNETLNESFKRELIEESFIEGEPDHLVSIEYNLKDKWFRFNFIGHKTGGRLKTLADQDKESLEARWFDVNEVLERKIDLRAYDILQVLKDAVEWLSSQSRLLFKSLPIHRHTGTLTLRIFVINDQLQLLVDGETLQIPEQPLLSKNLSYLSVIKLNAAYPFANCSKIIGLMSIEYGVKDNSHGVCFNLLCASKNSVFNGFVWKESPVEFKSCFKDIVSMKAFVILRAV